MKTHWKVFLPLVSVALLAPLLIISFRGQNTNSQLQNLNERSPANLANLTRTNGSSNFQNTQEEVVTPTLSLPVSELPQVSADVNPELVREINPRISHSLPNWEKESRNQSQFLSLDTNDDHLPSSNQLSPSEPITSSNVFTTPILNFTGSPFTQVNPPDTVGAIGKSHYIQMVNGSSGAEFRIYDRSGMLEHGPIALESLGSGNCSVGGGDPIVIYDQLADRWFMSEFHNQTSANVVCHYISQTNDPAGSWFAYEFSMPNFPDYPKYGLWPTAYIGTANEVGGGSDPLPAIYAFDRSKMLKGEPASYIRFVPPRLAGFGFQAFTPVDMDGFITPPTSSPPLYLRHRDDEVHNSGSNNSTADFIEIWSMTPDFSNPSNSSFTQIANIQIDEFDSTMCGVGSFSCVPQNGSSTRLDPVREVLMHRVQYINHGTHQSIVGNMVTDTTGEDQNGIFWFELRNINGNWTLHQDGVLAPDAIHRWMGSISMDSSQNIALIYNASGTDLFPSLRYTGRRADMPLGTLIGEEGSIGEGGGSNSSNRYGDYNSLTLDPVDGCTFWATGQYNPSSTWSTRIATIKFPNCQNAPSFLLQNLPDPIESLNGTLAQIPVIISASEEFTETVSFSISNLSSGQVLNISPVSLVPITTPITVTISITNAQLGVNSFEFIGTSPKQASTLPVEFTVVNQLDSAVTIINPADGADYVSIMPTFKWLPVSGATSYKIELSTDPLFLTDTQQFAGVESTTFSLPAPLQTDFVYHWRIQPVNNLGAGPWASATFQTEPPAGSCQAGVTPSPVLQTGFESGLGEWEVSGVQSSWQVANNRFTEGTASVKASAHAFTSTQLLTSPSFNLAPLTDARWLSFDLWRDTESSSLNCHDGLAVEIEKNGNWESVPELIASNPYDNVVSAGFGNVLEGKQAWCGSQDWTQTLIDLSDYSGEIRLRYHLATDSSVGREGVYVDNVQIYECNPRSYTYYFPFAGGQ